MNRILTDRELEINLREIKISTLEMIESRGFGHLGGSFSILEVLNVLYGRIMKYDTKQLNDDGRDYFVLSKGHAGPGYYSTLANYGFFSKEVLMTLNQNGTILPSHPDRNLTPGVDTTTGSLGQGISQAIGIAYGLKVKESDNKVFCIIGDGECNEGQVWEAFQFAQNKKLDNLIIIVDDNKQQVDGLTGETSFSFDFPKIFDAFGFEVRVENGSDSKGIEKSILELMAEKNKAKVLILDSIKSQGLLHYEDQLISHHLRLSADDADKFKENILMLEKEIRDLKEGKINE